MLDLGMSVFKTKPPTRKLIVEWMMKAYNNISVEVVTNSSKHGTILGLIIMKLIK